MRAMRSNGLAGWGVAAAMVFAALSPQAEAAPRHRAVEPAKPATPEKAFPFDITWVLTSLNDKPLAGGDPPSFSIDQTLRARGFAGCNTFSMALYPVRDQHLASGSIAVTRKVCPPEVMALERAMLVGLHSGPKWELRADGDLAITAPRIALRFRRGI